MIDSVLGRNTTGDQSFTSIGGTLSYRQLLLNTQIHSHSLSLSLSLSRKRVL